jgi:hypothetical protein
MKLRLTHVGKLLLLLAALASIGQSASDPGDELKAAVVLSFLRYTEWTSVPAQDPITVAVAGRSDFAKVLRKALEAKTVGAHRLAVVEVQDGPFANCQILYIAFDRGSDVRRILAAASSSHLLTIGEADRFLDWGGAINLMTLDGHMSFEVNLDAVTRSGDSVSSKLLRFGQIRGAK